MQLALALGPDVKQEPASDKEDEDADEGDGDGGDGEGDDHEGDEGEKPTSRPLKKRVLTRRDSLTHVHACHILYECLPNICHIFLMSTHIA